MNEPDDFGLTPLETLSHIADTTPAGNHKPFWARWSEAVWSRPATLVDAPPEMRVAGVTHAVESLRHVRIGCRLIEPGAGARPRGVVLLLHGYDERGPLDDAHAWVGRGMAVLKLRVRGFEGSEIDTPDLAAGEGGWVTHGLGSPDDSALAGGVADVAFAFRALRRKYGPEMDIGIRGESFGAGLAVIAAGQIAQQDAVFRLALGLPTFGDWGWRSVRPANAGVGAEIAQHLLTHAGRRESVLGTLRLFDSAVHARRIRCPVLCKLAERDDVVPAPTAAAVFNALGTDPGLKWRYITRYGHFDGGIADVRRHALFERLVADFLDPATDLASFHERWGEALREAQPEGGVEDDAV